MNKGRNVQNWGRNFQNWESRARAIWEPDQAGWPGNGNGKGQGKGSWNMASWSKGKGKGKGKGNGKGKGKGKGSVVSSATSSLAPSTMAVVTPAAIRRQRLDAWRTAMTANLAKNIIKFMLYLTRKPKQMAWCYLPRHGFYAGYKDAQDEGFTPCRIRMSPQMIKRACEYVRGLLEYNPPVEFVGLKKIPCYMSYNNRRFGPANEMSDYVLVRQEVLKGDEPGDDEEPIDPKSATTTGSNLQDFDDIESDQIMMDENYHQFDREGFAGESSRTPSHADEATMQLRLSA
jgi:hypothetical protein